jgi:hypothetical protein
LKKVVLHELYRGKSEMADTISSYGIFKLVADMQSIKYFMDFLYLLRYTVIIYKFTQGNLGAKKIARIRFQSPVKKKNRKLRHWRTDSATIEWLVCGYDHHMIVGFIAIFLAPRFPCVNL